MLIKEIQNMNLINTLAYWVKISQSKIDRIDIKLSEINKINIQLK